MYNTLFCKPSENSYCTTSNLGRPYIRLLYLTVERKDSSSVHTISDKLISLRVSKSISCSECLTMCLGNELPPRALEPVPTRELEKKIEREFMESMHVIYITSL